MQHDVGAIPDFFIATNAEQFKEAYKKLSAKYEWVCFKFVHDEGGKSYRLIDNNRKGYAALFKKQTTRISFDAVPESLRMITVPQMRRFVRNQIIDCVHRRQGDSPVVIDVV